MANIYGSTAPTLTGSAYTNPGPISFNVRFTLGVAGVITALRYYVSSTNTAVAQPVGTVYLWGAGITALAAKTFSTSTTVGWQTVVLDSPVAVTTGQTYIAVFAFDTSATMTYGAQTGRTVPVTVGDITVTGYGYRETAAYADKPSATGTNDYKVDIELGSSSLAISAGVDQSGFTSAAYSLNAIASGGAGTKSYAWTKLSGPTGAFSGAAAAATDFTPTAAGVYVLRCTVTDDTGSVSDDVTLTVSDPASQTGSSLYSHTVAPALTASVANEPGTYSIGTVLKSISGGEVLSVWYYVGVASTALSAIAHIYPYSAPNLTQTALASKPFTVQTSIGWQEIILDTPVIIPANGRFITAISFPGDIARYSYTSGVFSSDITNGDIVGEAGATVGNGRFSNDASNELSKAYPLKASTGFNWYGVDAFVVKIALSIDAGVDQNIDTGTAASLVAAASGGSGTYSYVWTKFSGPTGAFSNAASGATDFTPTTAGVYILRCTVTDDAGSIFDDVTLTVSDPGFPAFTDAVVVQYGASGWNQITGKLVIWNGTTWEDS